MKKTVILFMLILPFLTKGQTVPSLLVEAESFSNTGGWVVDQQFIPSMVRAKVP